MRQVVWIRRLALIAALLAFAVVVLGGYTRLSDSGLGCPDWPGCFGQIAPVHDSAHYADEPAWQKAWAEMRHRYFAELLGLLIVVIAALSIRARREPGVRVAFSLMMVVLVLLQGMLGMLTVTWLLTPLIVTAHLLGGLTTFALLWWLWLSMRAEARAIDGYTVLGGNVVAEDGGPARLWAGIALAVLAVQVALGGWTSSNYATIACPDVPKCQAQWVPAEADFKNAFVLWRGHTVNHAGGILEHPARVAIHFTHRVGAVVTTSLLLLAAFLALRGLGSQPSWAAIAVLAALATQISIGVFMVLRAFPLELAAAHNAGAALLVAATVLLNRRLRPVRDFR